jgi:hypothetical protein
MSNDTILDAKLHVLCKHIKQVCQTSKMKIFYKAEKLNLPLQYEVLHHNYLGKKQES